MRLFCYYAIHSLINQIKKLCRTWFIIFILACFFIGIVIGGAIGLLAEVLPDDPGYEDGEFPDEELPDEELPPDEEIPDDEIIIDIDIDSEEGLVMFIDFVIAFIVILVLVFSSFSADKNGSAIFTMADVNLLFAAPMKPQSVLLFKLMTQILLVAFSSVYIICQLPTLAMAFGFNVFTAFTLIFAWILLCVYSKLLNVLIYTVASTHDALKKYIRPACVAIILVTVLPMAIMYAATGEPFIVCAFKYLSMPFMRYIPVFGWLKGLVVFAIQGKYWLSVLYFILLVLGAGFAAWGIWKIKADFYEDAMAKSEETAATLTATQEGTAAKRKKDRVERIKRNEMKHGSGANMFFCRSMYNRFRFAYLRVFTKTNIFYMMIAVGLALMFKFIMHSDNFVVIGFAVSGLVFFRSLGNPLAQDVDKPYLVTVPASAHAKVFWSLLGGTLDAALDTLPAILISGILLWASPWEMLAFWFLAIAVDFYANNVMLFIELSLPSSLAMQFKQMVMILFVYFGLAPIIIVAAVSYIFISAWIPVLFISALAALAIAFIFFAFSPLFLSYGRK